MTPTSPSSGRNRASSRQSGRCGRGSSIGCRGINTDRLEPHHPLARLAQPQGFFGQWSASVEQRLSPALDRGTALHVLEGQQAGDGGVLQRALHERRGSWPPTGIRVEPGISAVSKEAGDRNVGRADLTEQETGLGKLAFQVIKRGRYLFRLRLVDAFFVRRLAPDERAHHLLVEECPDEEVAEPRVGIFLEPARACAP